MASQDDVRIEIANESHREGILDLAKNVFTFNEPVSSALKPTWESAKAGWDYSVNISLKQPVSHVAVNSSNKVVGFRLSRIVNLQSYQPSDSFMEFVPEGPIRNIIDHLTKDWATVLVNDKGERSQKLLQFVALCVHPDYGGRGLAEKMCRENLALGKKLGCEYCLVIGSNWMSQRVFEKIGFTNMSSIDYSDYRNEFEITDPKQKHSKAYYLKL